MSKAYEETMLTLTLTGAVMKILSRTFTVGDFKNDHLKEKCDNLYELVRELTKIWPQQNSEKAIKNIQEKTNSQIRKNKHLQGTGVYAISLMTLITGRMIDLNGFIKDPIRKNRMDIILTKLKELNDIFIDNMDDKDLRDKQFKIGDSIYEELEEI